MLKYLLYFLLPLSTLSALDEPCFPFELSVGAGWRRDDLFTTEKASNSSDSSNWHDKISAKRLNVWQYGAKLRSTLSGWAFYQHSFFLDNFYFRGSAYGGTISGGTYNEGSLSHFISSPTYTSSPSRSSQIAHARRVDSFKDDFFSDSSWCSSSWCSNSSSSSSSSRKHRNHHGGSTLDADIALGINFPVSWWFNIAPVLGYSIDKQKIELPDQFFKEIYTTKWKGPFAGFDISSEFCYFRFRGGYEYHWGDWQASFEIKQKKKWDHLHYSHYRDSRRGNGAQGHVAWLDLRFALDCQFDLGLGLKYQYWEVPRGKITEDNTFPSSSSTRRTLRSISWHSMAINGEIVYRF